MAIAGLLQAESDGVRHDRAAYILGNSEKTSQGFPKKDLISIWKVK